MARLLRTYPTRSRKPLKFAQFLDGRIWRLLAGKDFSVQTHAARSQIYQTARKLGVDVRITQCDNHTLVLQSRPAHTVPSW